ncbi:hypothetical protein TWF281_008280 [Arthrobotrys megalospora]
MNTPSSRRWVNFYEELESYPPRVDWKPSALDLLWEGYRPRMIDFEYECDLGPVATPTRHDIESRRNPWLGFPDYSPTRANSISSSIPSSDERFESQPRVRSHRTGFRSHVHPSPAQTGLRVFNGRRGVDSSFGASSVRNQSRPTPPIATPSEPVQALPQKKTLLERVKSKAEQLGAFDIWQRARTVIKKQTFVDKSRTVWEWSCENKFTVLFILLSWCTMFILAQTKILRVDTWEFLNPDLRWKNHRLTFFSSTKLDNAWRPDPRDIITLLFSKNSSQTIIDAKILYHLQNIEERQGQLHDKVQRQLNDNAIVLDYMLKEIRNLKFAFSTVGDRKHMERQVDRLKDEIKQCNEDMFSRTTQKPIIIKQRPTYTVTKMTKTVFRSNYKTVCPRPVVSTKVVVYPNKSTGKETDQSRGFVGKIFGASGDTAAVLTEKDVDRIAQRLAKSLNLNSKDKISSDPWWNVFPSFFSTGGGTEGRIGNSLELIIQLLCPEESGFLAGSFSTRVQTCLKRRRALSSIMQSRMRSTIPNRILSTSIAFADHMPPIGVSIISGTAILFYAPSIATWIGKHQGGDRKQKVLRISAVCFSVLSVLFWPARLATIWIWSQERFEPIRTLSWDTRFWAAFKSYLVLALEKVPVWLPSSLRVWWQSLDLIGKLKAEPGLRFGHGSNIQPSFHELGRFSRYTYIGGVKNILWAGIPYMVLKCLFLLTIFVFATRGLPAIRLSLENIKCWTSRQCENIFRAIKQTPDIWRRNRALLTKEWIIGLPMLIYILVKQFIIGIRDKFLRSFQQAKRTARQWIRKARGTGISFQDLFQKKYIAPGNLLRVARVYAPKIWGTIRSLIPTDWEKGLGKPIPMGPMVGPGSRGKQDVGKN